MNQGGKALKGIDIDPNAALPKKVNLRKKNRLHLTVPRMSIKVLAHEANKETLLGWNL